MLPYNSLLIAPPPLEKKLAAFNFFINGILTLPITKQTKQQEWKIILAIAQNNGFPLHVNIIHKLKKKLTAKKTKTKTPNHNNTKNKKMGNILLSQSTNTKNN